MSTAHSSDDSPAYALREELRDAPVGYRIMFVVYLSVGAFGGLGGAYMLFDQTRHWISWTIALLVVEPIGVACLLGLFAMIAPDSLFAMFLGGALKRARLALLILFGSFGLFVGGMTLYAGWELLTK